MSLKTIVLELPDVEVSQYLAKIQQDLNLETPSQAVQYILNKSCRETGCPDLSVPLSTEHQEKIVKVMVGLEQCQTWLSDILLTLHTLTLQAPMPIESPDRPKRRKMAGSSKASKKESQPVNVLPLSIAQMQKGVTGQVLSNRLGVSAATVSRKRSGSNFSKWSQENDPAGIAWVYSGATRRFHPASASSVRLDGADPIATLEDSQ